MRVAVLEQVQEVNEDEEEEEPDLYIEPEDDDDNEELQEEEQVQAPPSVLESPVTRRLSGLMLHGHSESESETTNDGTRSARNRRSKKLRNNEGLFPVDFDVNMVAIKEIREQEVQQQNRARMEQNAIERLKLAEMKRKNDLEVEELKRKNDREDRAASLDNDLKEIDLKRQKMQVEQEQIAHNMELLAKYTELKEERGISYAQIAQVFPMMIPLFPPEEMEKYSQQK